MLETLTKNVTAYAEQNYSQRDTDQNQVKTLTAMTKLNLSSLKLIPMDYSSANGASR